MSDTGNPTGDPSGTGGSPPAPPTPSGVTFTQADLDRINAETRRQAEAATSARMLKELGVEDLAAVKQIIADRQAADDAAKTELQKAQDAAARLQQERDDALATAQRTLITSEVRNALRDAGINPERIDGAMRLADLADVTVKDGALDGVAAVVEKVKAGTPEWFGAPGRPFSAPDASLGGGGGGGEKDFRTATDAEWQAEARRYGINPLLPSR